MTTATMTKTTAKPKAPKDAQLFWAPNLTIGIRAQWAKQTYSAHVSYKGETIVEQAQCSDREEAAKFVRDGLQGIGLDKLTTDTLLEILDSQAGIEELKGKEYPSTTIHVTVA